MADDCAGPSKQMQGTRLWQVKGIA